MSQGGDCHGVLSTLSSAAEEIMLNPLGKTTPFDNA
jgi:hypothetical protein